jgi:hypothetical protein
LSVIMNNNALIMNVLLLVECSKSISKTGWGKISFIVSFYDGVNI